ncbi:MAG: diacylglycerol kinase family lipid kinase [Bacteroidales bacterium]|nr:diacylglycerol kinase family lipid kinase [Bacteroidales bacterium]
MDNTQNIVFIINPLAGGKDKSDLIRMIRAEFDPAKYNVRIEQTKYPGHSKEICMDIPEKSIVVAVGGDGTVNETVAGIAGRDITMGIIPVGSGNGLARHLRIPVNPEKALQVIKAGKNMKIDTGLINGIPFVNIAGVGFDGRMARRFAQGKTRGFWGYLLNFIREFPGYKPKNYMLEIHGERRKVKALFIAFANSDQFGYNTTIAPDADISDGLLDVCIVRKPFFLELPVIAGLLFWHVATRSIPKVTFIKASEVQITMNKKRYCNIDGEAVKLGKVILVKVRPSSLKVLAP